MADEADVESVLVDLIVAAVYPNGTGAASAIGAPCKVYRGWPLAAQLDTDLSAGTVNVSVFARNGVEQVATRYPQDWVALAPPTHTITATVAGSTVTLDGTVTAGQNVSVAVGRAGQATYATKTGDTLAGIASALAAALTSGAVTATAAGAVITTSGPGILSAGVGGSATAYRELRRQNKSFQISLWCPSPDLRDTAAGLIDPALAAINFIALPDGLSGLLRYERTITIDTAEKMQEYRRDLFYWVEYPTVVKQAFAEVISGATPLVTSP